MTSKAKNQQQKMFKLDRITSPLSDKIVALDLEILINRKNKSFINPTPKKKIYSFIHY